MNRIIFLILLIICLTRCNSDQTPKEQVRADTTRQLEKLPDNFVADSTNKAATGGNTNDTLTPGPTKAKTRRLAEHNTDEEFPEANADDANCVYKSKYSAEQRSEFYPFNIADTIKLVSFRYHREDYPVKKDTVLTDSLIEALTLSKNEIYSLTDILYNNFYKHHPNYDWISECGFFPRNAILFLDKAGSLKGFILLCFHCDGHKESSDEVFYGDNCFQKMEKLRAFFISKGLKFGTDKDIEAYPGEIVRD